MSDEPSPDPAVPAEPAPAVPTASRRRGPRLSRRALLLAFTGGAALAVAASPAAAGTRPRRTPPLAPPAGRVDDLLARLTLDEKVSLLHGATDPGSLGQAGHVPGVPRLGIPPLRLADGPAGIRVRRTATALPAPVMLAAAFDPGLARAYGRVIGREGRALGQDVLLSPMANLIRTPYAGRNFETFSEDPLLTADLVAEEIRGIQAEGLVATVKHFALNNQERDRTKVDVRADEQTQHETELRAFEAAVAAGAGAVMAAYNKVDGVHAAENATLLTAILRDRWGFDGWVMSDWNAVHTTGPALAAGLDMEMPGGSRYGAALRDAVRAGRIEEAAVDRSVRRILSVRERFGLLDDTPSRPARDAASGARLALRVATAGATLLRNERGALPLTAPAARSLAVIGPTATVPFVSGGGSAHVVPDAAAKPLDTIRARAGEDGSVAYALGEDLFGRPLPPLSPAVDLEGVDVAAGATWTRTVTLTATDPDEWTFLVHYSGPRPTATLDGTALFPVKQGIAEYFVGGLLGRAPDGLHVRRTTLRLAAGQHKLTVTAHGGPAGQLFRLRAVTGATRAADVAEAVRVARAAHSVVLFAYEDATEGQDRGTLALPGHQEALIEAVTAANARTTVVLNTSSAVTMPWLERTAAVLQMYYPGQEGAAATTAVLFGDADPGGRLTQTFPAAEDRHPTAGNPRRYPGVDGVEEYGEGVHVGHRWYDAQGVTPLFPFGHGLSYTTFRYEDLTVGPGAEGGAGGLDVTFSVRNTGRRDGVEVAQVYVGPSPDLTALEIDQPRSVLAGYRRLELAAGERRRVTVHVTARTLSSWDTARHDWLLGTGRRTVRVGASSADPGLTVGVEVRPS
ncbi:glycoside hydrolase family 3 C-terminal domain-containing protein [Streptomyces sp. SBC-4]|nr:glycoside hydrolase family 3 C-terminal domain-containing protein [Streptomyces sp. SBC-4]MDV5144243.1 glycoside hydrolase family 3 C-terminal domain-containing protein [Streptomyces sp. SBC-4]